MEQAKVEQGGNNRGVGKGDLRPVNVPIDVAALISLSNACTMSLLMAT